jgi:hypothetical protein
MDMVDLISCKTAVGKGRDVVATRPLDCSRYFHYFLFAMEPKLLTSYFIVSYVLFAPSARIESF